MSYKILTINPGSTSDDIGVFEGGKIVFEKTIRYPMTELSAFDGKKVTEQYEFRKKSILSALSESGVEIKNLSAVIGRGGLVKPIPGGVYAVNEKLKEDLRKGVMGDHPSNLGGLLASEIADRIGAPSFIADPVVVDELEPLARYSGNAEIQRISIFHALNQKRTARLTAEKLNKKYGECNLIVVHMGGGISVGAHKNGRVIDVNNALDGDGPFTPQRSGGLPAGALVKMCFGGKYALDEMKLKLKGKGGLVSYTGTSDIQAIKEYIRTGKPPENSGINADKILPEKSREVLSAMMYQISKEIGAMYAVLKGQVDAVVLTGGIAHNDDLVGEIKERIGKIAPIFVFPGGDEKSALKDAATLVLDNPKEIKNYD